MFGTSWSAIKNFSENVTIIRGEEIIGSFIPRIFKE